MSTFSWKNGNKLLATSRRKNGKIWRNFPFMQDEYARFFGGEKGVKWKNTCWNAWVFHIIHRLFHRAGISGVWQGSMHFGLHNDFRQKTTFIPFFRQIKYSQQVKFYQKNNTWQEIFCPKHTDFAGDFTG